MHRIQVGLPYHPDVRRWSEGAEYNWRGGGHELVLRLSRPTAVEVAAVQRAPLDLALWTGDDVLVLLYRFGAGGSGIPWSDAPYSIHRVPEAERVPPPELEPGQMPLMTVVLLDADTGIVRVVRAVSLPHGFGAALHAAIRAQLERPYPGDAAYEAEIAQLFRRWPQSKALAAAAQHRASAGQEAGDRD
jgi:hypothetical protein